MTDTPHVTTADPNIKHEGYEPPTSADELLERYNAGESGLRPCRWMVEDTTPEVRHG